jgi:thiamine-monophosphate kinase
MNNPANPEKLGEFDIISRLFKPLSRGYEGALALQDDAAILPPLDDYERIITTDCVISGVHFRTDDPPGSVAARALGVNVSDLAAMGAIPEAYTLALAIAHGTSTHWLESFAQHLSEMQSRYEITLIGGDTVSTPGPLSITITAIGQLPMGTALKRSTAKPGDDIYVSGTIGDGALGLKVGLDIDQPEIPGISKKSAEFLLNRFQYPQARLKLGQALRQSGLVHGCCDISDGLIADLGHICLTSGCGGEINVDLVPLSEAVQEVVQHDPAFFQTALTGGDDYELIFTVPPDQSDAIDAIAQDTAVKITRIGHMTGPENDLNEVILNGKNAQLLSNSNGTGYIHCW